MTQDAKQTKLTGFDRLSLYLSDTIQTDGSKTWAIKNLEITVDEGTKCEQVSLQQMLLNGTGRNKEFHPEQGSCLNIAKSLIARTQANAEAMPVMFEYDTKDPKNWHIGFWKEEMSRTKEITCVADIPELANDRGLFPQSHQARAAASKGNTGPTK